MKTYFLSLNSYAIRHELQNMLIRGNFLTFKNESLSYSLCSMDLKNENRTQESRFKVAPLSAWHANPKALAFPEETMQLVCVDVLNTISGLDK